MGHGEGGVHNGISYGDDIVEDDSDDDGRAIDDGGFGEGDDQICFENEVVAEARGDGAGRGCVGMYDGVDDGGEGIQGVGEVRGDIGRVRQDNGNVHDRCSNNRVYMYAGGHDGDCENGISMKAVPNGV